MPNLIKAKPTEEERQSSTRPRPKTFTCFRRLPREIQDMVWDEALLLPEYTILAFNYFMVDSKYPEILKFTVRGHDTSKIARACKDAVERWRALYTPVALHPQIPSISIRLREEMTILVAATEGDLCRYLMATSPAYGSHAAITSGQSGVFRPRHVAFWASTENYQDSRPFWHPPMAPFSASITGLQHQERFPAPLFLFDNLIRMRHGSGISLDVADRELARTVKEQDPMEEGIFSNGVEWMRRIRPKQMTSGPIDFTPGGTELPLSQEECNIRVVQLDDG